jgi:polar amino acid transport system substrate-binding protein
MTTPSSSHPFRVFAVLVILGGAGLGLRGLVFDTGVVVDVPEVVTPGANELSIFYHARRPYYFTEKGEVRGLVVEPTRAALERAGITHRWVELPPARQLRAIAMNAQPAAAIGWFENEARRRFAQFSDIIYEDGAFVVLAHRDNVKIIDGMALEMLLDDFTQVLLMKDAYSYGSVIDDQIARRSPPQVHTPGDNAAMVRMLVEGRADYALFTPEEARVLVAQAERGNELVVRELSLDSMPPGGKRHLMFSLAVPGELIDRFNQALREGDDP